MERKIMLSAVNDGDVFELAGFQFVKFPEHNGMTPVVLKDTLFDSKFGADNNFATSEILDRLTSEFLPKVEAAVGKENLCLMRTDLTTLDGLKPYEDLHSLVSLPTLDFYRENVGIFDKYKPDAWWWLATPDSAQPHDDPDFCLCVSPSGHIRGDDCYYRSGVRPLLALKSSIFGSCEA